jgi:hypothetical protein
MMFDGLLKIGNSIRLKDYGVGQYQIATYRETLLSPSIIFARNRTYVRFIIWGEEFLL